MGRSNQAQLNCQGYKVLESQFVLGLVFFSGAGDGVDAHYHILIPVMLYVVL